MFKRILIGLIISSCFLYAGNKSVNDTNIKMVFVNGVTDSPNAGTTCVTITGALADVCLGYVAIKNNNQALISAALHAKGTEKSVWFYYNDSAGNNHCPGKVHTPCAVNSIGLK